jgi:hypothetical protein
MRLIGLEVVLGFLVINPKTAKALGLTKAVLVGSCGFGLFLGACAIANTPQQDLAYARWAKCNSTSSTLERVDLDGRIMFRYTTAGDRQEIVQCLAEAARAGPPLPEPVGFRPVGGP